MQKAGQGGRVETTDVTRQGDCGLGMGRQPRVIVEQAGPQGPVGMKIGECHGVTAGGREMGRIAEISVGKAPAVEGRALQGARELLEGQERLLRMRTPGLACKADSGRGLGAQLREIGTGVEQGRLGGKEGKVGEFQIAGPQEPGKGGLGMSQVVPERLKPMTGEEPEGVLGARHLRTAVADERGLQGRAGRTITRGIVVPQGHGHHGDTAHGVAQELAVAGLDPQAAAARHHPKTDR